MGKMTALALSDSRGDMMEDNKIMCNYNLPEVVRFRCRKKLTKIDFNFSTFVFLLQLIYIVNMSVLIK